MSDVAAPAKRPESLAGILGVGAVILIALATGLSILGSRARVLDPLATFAGWFEPTTLPFGLQPLEAARQADGTLQVHLADPALAPEPEPEPIEPPEDAGEKAQEDPAEPPPPRFDWRAIAIGPAGAPPREGLLVTWPLGAARAQLARLFEQGGMRDFDDDEGPPGVHDPLAGLGAEGGRLVIGSGRLEWGEFEAPYVHERRYEPGGTFTDTLRCNLSGEREALVLFLRWPRGLPASTERATEFLAALRRAAPAQNG